MKIKYRNISVLIFAILIAISFQGCSKDEVANNIIDEGGGNLSSANQQPTGTSANDLLSDKSFTSAIVEVAYVEGFEPTQEAVDNFMSFLESRTFKPDGISVITTIIPSTGNSNHTIQDIIAIEDANRTVYNFNNQIAIWAFFSDGESASNSNNSVVLGTAYRNTSFVIFEKTIHDLSNSAFEPDRSLLETTVITHEFGHILGLTNLGTDLQTPHEDTQHPKHCDVENCLMYWSAETGSGLENLINSGTAPQLDPQCIADLRANGGK
jgi:hypothetical protein